MRLNGNRPKAAKEVAIGDTVAISRGETTHTVVVAALAERRGSASVAATLYAETPASIEQREAASAARRIERASLRPPSRRPDKRARRQLIAAKSQNSQREDA